MPIKTFDVTSIPADWDVSRCFDEAKILYDDGKYAQSLPLFYKAAIEGDRQAQERLIVMFSDGQGTEPDDENTNYWIVESRKIASEATAAFAKASEYFKENKKQLAFEQLKFSAEKGSVEGQYHLARIYEYDFVRHKYEYDFVRHKKATKWYLKAAKQSHKEAQFEIGLRYIGEKPGLEQSQELAAYWLLQSKLPEASPILASILKSHPAEFDKAEEKIRLQKDKERGVATQDAEALFEKAITRYYLHDKESAFKLMYEAAKLGHISAQCIVAAMYYKGEGVEKDLKEAFAWSKKAAENGDVISQVMLAWMYYNGEGVSQNFKQAYELAKIVAENGDVISQDMLAQTQAILANIYYHGEGVPQDFKQAYNWAKKAAGNGFPTAQKFLANFKESHPNIVREIEREAGAETSRGI